MLLLVSDLLALLFFTLDLVSDLLALPALLFFTLDLLALLALLAL